MRTVRVGRLAGIPIGIQPLWLVIVGLITWSLGSEYFPSRIDGIAPENAYALGLLGALLLFASILLHELGHATVARRRGVEIEEIDLWLLGGVARMKQEPRRARDELEFAAAGPLVTVVIVVAFAVLDALLPQDRVPALRALVEYELYVNLAILALNLLPAFPLDGGRIARAFMWLRSGDREGATLAAARTGRGFGIAMIVLGMMSFASGAPAGLWLALIGGFLLFAATAEAQHAAVQDRFGGQTVRTRMTSPVVAIPAQLSVDEAVAAYFVRHLHSAFPVVDEHGRAIGLLTIGAVRRMAAPLRATTSVGSAADGDPDLLVGPDDAIADVIATAAFLRNGRAVAVDSTGQPVGILSITDIQRWIRAVDLLPPAPATAPSPAHQRRAGART